MLLVSKMNSVDKILVSDKLLLFAQDLDRRRTRTKIVKSNGTVKRVSQSDIATAVGISTQTYQRYISENFLNCSLDVFIKIVKYLEDNSCVMEL